jgi:hypothetical protein
MPNAWVLIILSQVAGGVAPAMAEFADLKACEAARDTIQKMINEGFAFHVAAVTFCMPKGVPRSSAKP